MFPIVVVPETLRSGMGPYREVFCRETGFEYISRDVMALLLNPNKTLVHLERGPHIWSVK